MSQENDSIKELELILRKFSSFIKANIQKFNIQKAGIDPEDIIQEVRIKIWKLLANEKKIKNYSSYIRKIINSSVIDQIRKLKREEGIIHQEKKKKISELKKIYAGHTVDSSQFRVKIGHAVDSLMESRRKVVRLFLLNMTLDEIAQFFGWTRDKTRNLLYRGLSDLKKRLKEIGIEYEDK